MWCRLCVCTLCNGCLPFFFRCHKPLPICGEAEAKRFPSRRMSCSQSKMWTGQTLTMTLIALHDANDIEWQCETSHTKEKHAVFSSFQGLQCLGFADSWRSTSCDLMSHKNRMESILCMQLPCQVSSVVTQTKSECHCRHCPAEKWFRFVL